MSKVIDENNDALIREILSKSKLYTLDQLNLKNKKELLEILKSLNSENDKGNTSREKRSCVIK